MAPSTPSSGAGATFTAIDLARWTLPQCRAKCWALGLPEYGLLSQLRSRLSRWRTAQLDAPGAPVTTPPLATRPPLATLPSPQPRLPTTPPPLLPPRRRFRHRGAPSQTGDGTPPHSPHSRQATTDRSRGSSVQAPDIRNVRSCERPRVALDDIHASPTTLCRAAEDWTACRAAGGPVSAVPGRIECQWRAQRRPR